MSRDRHTCPRRMQEMGPWDREENLDRWSKRSGLVKSKEPACTFCGSMQPDRFMHLIEHGYELGTTVKDYKAYLHNPTGGTVGKFYYQHLDEEQKLRFIHLLNSREVNIGVPGYFPVLPFFCRPNPAG